MKDITMRINQSPPEPTVINITGGEYQLFKLSKAILYASDFDPGDSVSVKIGNAVYVITQATAVPG